MAILTAAQILCAIFLICPWQSVLANENEPSPTSLGPGHAPGSPLSLTPTELFDRTQKALKTLEVEDEPLPQTWLSPPQSFDPVAKNIKLTMDPLQQWLRFAATESNRNEGQPTWSVYQDRDSKQVFDFSIKPQLKHGGSHLFPPLSNPRLPLEGLKIALDPGHMGGEFWDHATGKFMHDKDGHVLSEGVLNLQVCLLLEKELTALGAEVLVTHTELRPVSDKRPTDLDLPTFAGRELRTRVFEDWFVNLMQESDVWTFDDLKAVPEIRHLFSEHQRMNYFILREDLAARSEKINAFAPQLTLVIHSDAVNSPGPDPTLIDDSVRDFTRAYVVGAFNESDFSTRLSRAQFLSHLLDQVRYQHSVHLGELITHEISTQLHIPLMKEDLATAVPIVPGVFARNLAVSRNIQTGVVSYLECVVYGNVDEFGLLISPDYNMTISGQNLPYSERTLSLVKAIRDGVLAFRKENP